MKLFRFEKWFFDVLTEEKDYIIVFHTITEICGFRLCFIEVNLGQYEESGTRFDKLHLNKKLKILKREGHTLACHEGNILIEPGMGNIRLSLGGLDLELAFSPVHNSDFNNAGMNIRSTAKGSLRWMPLYLKAMVSGKIGIEGEDKVLVGNAYADYLISTLSPFKIPIRQLYWGRLHSQDLDLTYSYALGDNQQVNASQMIVQTAGKRIQIEKLIVHPGEFKKYSPPGILCPTSYRLEASGDSIDMVLSVEHKIPAVVSEFAENPERMGSLRRAILKRISRDPRGIKFYASARLEYTIEGNTYKLDELLMIDEFVVFS